MLVLFLGRMIVSVDQGSYMEHLLSDWIAVPDYFVFRARGDVLFPSGSRLSYEGLCKVSLLYSSLGKPKGLYYGDSALGFSFGVRPKNF